jgi:cardiolipin synthase
VRRARHNPLIASSHTLFTDVEPFYQALLEGISTAKERVSMMYFTFDHGVWANKVAAAMVECAARGVKVRLMVDEIGLAFDDPTHAVYNRLLMDDLRSRGVEVCVFHPQGHRLNRFNRLHIKVCAVDEGEAFIGGSNIGDHYLELSDHNLEVRGEIGPVLHDVYDYVEGFTRKAKIETDLHLSRLIAGSAQVWLTVPKKRKDIRRALLDVILDAEKSVTIRSWYFIPDPEILDALNSQAMAGVAVRILLSDKTRMALVDAANPILAEDLTKAGAQVYRYTARSMHAKAAWNDKGDVLFGSANIDGKAMGSNFELSVFLRDAKLAQELSAAFDKDAAVSTLHKLGDFSHRSFFSRTLAHVSRLATPWL